VFIPVGGIGQALDALFSGSKTPKGPCWVRFGSRCSFGEKLAGFVEDAMTCARPAESYPEASHRPAFDQRCQHALVEQPQVDILTKFENRCERPFFVRVFRR